MSTSSRDECLLRTPPRRTRAHADALSCSSSSANDDEHQQLLRSSTPHHHQLSREPTKDVAQIFDFFYQVVFSLVHIALTVVLAPVLGGKEHKRHNNQRRTRGDEYPMPSQSSSSSSLPQVDMMDDPESGISVGSRGSAASSSASSSYQPILKVQLHQQHQQRVSGHSSGEKKSVRFPVPQRSRPPLGRIGLNSSSPAISSSSSRSAASSSSSRSETKRRDSRNSTASSRSSTAPNNKRGSRRTTSPLGRLASPRMQSTYFLE